MGIDTSRDNATALQRQNLSININNGVDKYIIYVQMRKPTK